MCFTTREPRELFFDITSIWISNWLRVATGWFFFSCFSIDFFSKSLNFSPTLRMSAIRKLRVYRVKHDCRRFQSFAPAGLFSHILVTLIPSFSRKLCLTLAYKETLSTIAFFRYLCCLPSRLQVTTGKWCSSSFFLVCQLFFEQSFFFAFASVYNIDLSSSHEFSTSFYGFIQWQLTF